VDDTRLIVPEPDAEPWPTLGPEVCDWLEACLVHGPGDVLGEPITLTDELRCFIYRAYEVFPREHELAGRRRFKRVVLSRRKGVGKTEIAAWLAIGEMDPQAPVRCDGWHIQAGEWVPVGRPVLDPYIPMVAVTEEQVEDLAYGAVMEIVQRCELAGDYDVAIERVVHRHAPGKIQALASAPSARDGGRTSFQHFDESHLLISERHRQAHKTMLRNVPKRVEADAWSLETTTMYAPGEQSVAEAAHRYAELVRQGKVQDPRILFDHRQASERHEIRTKRGTVNNRAVAAALREASGDAWEFTDVPSVIAQLQDPEVDEAEFRRYWLNQRRKAVRKWLSTDMFAQRAARREVAEGEQVVLAFDGSYSRDSTVLVGATVEPRPHVFLVAAWEKPLSDPGGRWRTPRGEVIETLDRAMSYYEVVELAPDPPGWHREVEDWEADYGEVVVRFETNQVRRFGPACDDFEQAVRDKELTHDNTEILSRHLGNCVAVKRRGYTVVTKSHPDSPDKIDSAVAMIVAHHRARWRHANDDGGADLGAVVIDPYGEEVPA